MALSDTIRPVGSLARFRRSWFAKIAETGPVTLLVTGLGNLAFHSGAGPVTLLVTGLGILTIESSSVAG
jgi:hypothetical protein